MAQTRSGARRRLNRPFWKARECLVWCCGVAEDRGNDKHIDVDGIGCAPPQFQRPQPSHLAAPGRSANGGYRRFLRLQCRDLTVGNPPSATELRHALRRKRGSCPAISLLRRCLAASKMRAEQSDQQNRTESDFWPTL
ncbi:hypothetical protein [Rhodobacter maris]|uniref:hypothetical protein n=1 Tax=Rhodobacter maris TaxID=446682 RepID=UPI000BE392DD|nr:hypothetical protein [Rhodobacter maris]